MEQKRVSSLKPTICDEIFNVCVANMSGDPFIRLRGRLKHKQNINKNSVNKIISVNKTLAYHSHPKEDQIEKK